MVQLGLKLKSKIQETTVRQDSTQQRKNLILNSVLTFKNKAVKKLDQVSIIKRNNYQWSRNPIIWALKVLNFND